MLPIKRPVSNFNFGGNPFWEINNHNNINQNDLNINNKINSNNHNNEIIIGKSNINKAPIIINELSQRNEANNYSKTSSKKENIFKISSLKYNNNNLDNLTNNINNNNNNIKIPKINKIKIEKGIMNNRLTNIFNKQLSDSKMNPNKNNIFQVKNSSKSNSVKK